MTSHKAVGAAVALALGLVGASGTARAQSAQQDTADCREALEDGNFKRAAARCDAAIRDYPKDFPAYPLRASAFYGAKQYAELVSWLEGTALKRFPDAPELMEWYALALEKTGKHGEAVKAAETAVARNNKLVNAQDLLCQHWSRPSFKNGKAEKAVAACEGYLASRDTERAKLDGKYLVLLGYAYLAQERYGDGLDRFEKAINIKRDGNNYWNANKGRCAALVGLKKYSQAITVCGDVIKAKKSMKGDSSPYYNLGLAFLQNGRLPEALQNANSYLQDQPNGARGHLLRGKIYRLQKNSQAESELTRALEAEPNNPAIIRELAGFYTDNNQPKKAIAQWEKYVKGNAQDPEGYAGLATGYLADKRPVDAATTADNGLKLQGQEKNYDLLVLAGDCHLAARDLTKARERYTTALEVKPGDQKVQTRVSIVIISQAKILLDKGNQNEAVKALNDALALDPGSVWANFNLGVIAIDDGRAADAIKFFQPRFTQTPNDGEVNRLLGRAYMLQGDNKKAQQYFAKAEEEYKKLNDNVHLGEMYVDWAPMLVAANAEDAVAKLELAERYSQGQPYIKAAQRNLQIAYFKRGYDRWRAKKTTEAVADLEGAVRYPANLQKNEEDAFTFALGLAYLSSGQEAKALPIFNKYGKLGALPFLKAPWDKFGADFFLAYAWYREGSAASRKNAATAFGKMSAKVTGAMGPKVKQLICSSWEFVALDAWTRGDNKGAAAALASAAASTPSPSQQRTIDHNQAVLKGGSAAQSTFATLGDSPPEALVNLGISFDTAGDAKRAYDLWTQAKAKGARAPKLDEWIAAKKRIYGF